MDRVRSKPPALSGVVFVSPPLKFSSIFRTIRSFCCSFGAVSSMFSMFLVLFEQFAPVFTNSLVSLDGLLLVLAFFLKLPCWFQAFCSVFLQISSLFPLVCYFFTSHSRFRAVCSLFFNSLVSFAWFVLCSFSSGLHRFLSFPLVLFERFAFCSLILFALWGGLLLVLEFSSFFRAVCSLFSSKSLISFERFAPCVQIFCKFFERFAPCFRSL